MDSQKNLNFLKGQSVKDQNDLLRIITNEIKSSIDQLQIVTPTVFASIFLEVAKSHALELDNEEQTALEIMDKECTTLMKLQTEASDKAMQLSHSTSKAISAIKDKDEITLSEVLRETQTLKEEIEKLKEIVYKDMLTNTYNRKWLHDNYIKNQSNVSNKAGVIALIDLNYFKLINDTYGHVIGDKILVFFAGEFLNTNYPVVRYGGDEFIIMFPAEVSVESAYKVLTDIRENILKKKFKANKQSFSVSFSFGLEKFNSNDVCSEILEAADKNMYEDKIQIKKRIPGL